MALGAATIRYVRALSADGTVLLVIASDVVSEACSGWCSLLINLGSPCSAADLVPPFHTLDFFDVAAFLADFAAGQADLNGDGAVDFFDVAAFLTAFAAGCG